MPTIPELKQQAETVVALCAEVLEATPEHGYIFLRSLHHWIESHPAYVPERAPLPERRLPMTDEECRAFEREIVPFGKCQGIPVGNANMEYLRWLADQRFVDDLRRYLANPGIKARSEED